MASVAGTADEINIPLRVDKWSQLTEDGTYTEKTICNGFPWRFGVSKDEKDELSFALFIYKENECNLWFCDASMEVTMINQKEGGENYKIPKIVKNRFTPDDCENGIELTLDEPNLITDPELGFIKDDTIIVEARIKVHSKSGKRFRKKIEYDMFSPSPKADGILVVEGHKVYVSKQLLAIQSPFFDRLFFGDFKEANESESEIHDVDIDELAVLLNMLYRTGEPFNDGNIEFILKLADRFEMLSILDEAEKYLLTSKDPEIHKKLRLSDQFNLVVLQDQLLPKYTADLIRGLKKSPEYLMLKEETKDLLFDKYIDFTTPK